MRKLLTSALLALAFAATPHAQAQVTTSDPALMWDLTSQANLALQLPGMSHHFEEPKEPGRRWNENNTGIGLEWRSPVGTNGWTNKTTVGLMRDSHGKWGGYGGYAWQYRLVDGASWQLDAGAGAFLFYRTVKFDGKLKLVPGVLPVLSIEHKPSGYGMNVLFVPNVKIGNYDMPAVLYAQFTKRF